MIFSFLLLNEFLEACWPILLRSSSSTVMASCNIEYAHTTADILSCPQRSVIAFSVSCSGAWSSDPSSRFVRAFPRVYREYQQLCRTQTLRQLLGRCLLLQENGLWIGCLFTNNIPCSLPAHDILNATKNAVMDLLRLLHMPSYFFTVLPGDEYLPTINLAPLHFGFQALSQEDIEDMLRSLPYRFRLFSY